MLSLLLLLLCGVACGAVATVFSVWFAFIRFDNFLQRMLERNEEAAIRALEDTRTSVTVPASKVEGICEMACFDGDVVWKTIPVRAVLFGSTVSVYRLVTREMSDDLNNTVVCGDQLIGKINTDSVISSVVKISKYHRHVNIAERCSPVSGQCLLLRHKPGLPLFLVDPVVQLKQRLRRKQREQTSRGTVHHSPLQDDDEDFINAKDTHSDQRNNSQSNNLSSSALDSSSSVDGSGEDYSKWTAVLFKMCTRRELERWYNLLQGNSQSEEWRNFIKRLTRADALSLVVARLYFANTDTSSLQDLLTRKIRRKLRRVSRRLPNHMKGEIILDRLELGEEIPLLDSVSDPVVSPNGEIEFDFYLLYRGGLHFSLRFSITYRGMRVPDIIFNVKVLQLSNRVRLNVGPPPSAKIWLSSPHTPHLQLEFTQEVATNDGFLHTLLKLLPDMSAIMTTIVKVKLFEDMLLPSMDDFPLPCLSYSPSSSEASDDGEEDVDAKVEYSFASPAEEESSPPPLRSFDAVSMGSLIERRPHR
ncbi:Putative integral membrane protein conserved region (DUF2404), putative [Trypanosoma equiperdum]|uniref:Integral membrane protein conserved region (DUF2404), putative n=1 Tax=Trypanosoma equiperdum TaxID=5694 RepID=A0A1G4I6V6_TRYEQ|nr:Putative integral membrane protein conserved region (DUF2404), putative [Trypanosoma equiperdum]